MKEREKDEWEGKNLWKERREKGGNVSESRRTSDGREGAGRRSNTGMIEESAGERNR